MEICAREKEKSQGFLFLFPPPPPTEGAKDWKQWTLDSGPTGRMQAEGIAGFRERTSDSNESRLPKAAAEATNINVFF